MDSVWRKAEDTGIEKSSSQYARFCISTLPAGPMEAQLPGVYLPCAASQFALARASSAACAFGAFSFEPIHVQMQVFCSALPNEKESAHGSEGKSLFISFRLIVAVSSLSSSRVVSPLRKKMPGIARRRRQST